MMRFRFELIKYSVLNDFDCKLTIKANRRVITTINWAATPPTLNQLARHGQRLGLLQYAL